MTVHVKPLPVGLAMQFFQLGYDITTGKVRALEDVRKLVEDMLALAAPVDELAPELTETGRAVAEDIADAAEDLKFGPEK